MIKTTRVFGSLQNNMKKKAGYLLPIIGCLLLVAGACSSEDTSATSTSGAVAPTVAPTVPTVAPTSPPVVEVIPEEIEEVEVVVYDDLAGKTLDQAVYTLGPDIPHRVCDMDASPECPMTLDSIIGRYTFSIGKGIVWFYSIETPERVLTFSLCRDWCEDFEYVTPPDAVCDDYSFLVGMTREEAEQVLLDAGLNSGNAPLTGDGTISEDIQKHFVVGDSYFTSLPRGTVSSVHQYDNCSPNSFHGWPIWIHVTVSLGEHPPEG